MPVRSFTGYKYSVLTRHLYYAHQGRQIRYVLATLTTSVYIVYRIVFNETPDHIRYG